ncbi:MAG: response regulator [Thermodesulfobacteriota bacterium]|nr:response regulator [Thermodesulfobacteriota bacterium]
MYVLLITSDNNSFLDLAAALEKNGMQTVRAESGGTAFHRIGNKTFDLVIIDEKLSDMTGLEFAEKLVSINPMMNCAMVSSLSPEDFHEASEGLGILMQLPLAPGKEDAEKLLKHLNSILNLTNRKV